MKERRNIRQCACSSGRTEAEEARASRRRNGPYLEMDPSGARPQRLPGGHAPPMANPAMMVAKLATSGDREHPNEVSYAKPGLVRGIDETEGSAARRVRDGPPIPGK